MKGIKIILILGLFSVVMACVQKEAEYPVVVEDIDGVKIVTNPDYPKDGVIEYTLVEDLSIGGDVDDADYIFHRPQGIKVGKDGMIYIMDWGDATIKLFDQEGQFIRVIGGKGQGPNEFGQLIYFSLGSGGDINVLDPVNHRVAVLNTEGEYLGGFRLEEGFPTELETDNQNNIYVGLSMREENLQWLNIRSFSRDGEELVNYGEFKLVQSIIQNVKTERGVTSMSSTSRHAATTVWKVSPKGKLYAGYGDIYQISVYDTDGSLDFKFGRQYTPVQNKYAGKAGQPKDVGVFNVITRHWLFDDEGNIWIEFFTGDEPEHIFYDVFSPDGIYLKQVQVKHRILQLFEGKAFCFVRDENEFVAVKRFLLVDKN
ncbi:MAG: 6-bladed beta-propeller [Candidatus Aminicenantes bacterium]|nr:6-bladed beta-propeller [Candidatus Aminicenantes bacterium]